MVMKPPSTVIVGPVMDFAVLEARKRIISIWP